MGAGTRRYPRAGCGKKYWNQSGNDTVMRCGQKTGRLVELIDMVGCVLQTGSCIARRVWCIKVITACKDTSITSGHTCKTCTQVRYSKLPAYYRWETLGSQHTTDFAARIPAVTTRQLHSNGTVVVSILHGIQDTRSRKRRRYW
jgi:hypothetical protein